MKVGDEILEIDAKPVDEKTATDALVGCDQLGDKVSIKYRRKKTNFFQSLANQQNEWHEEVTVVRRVPLEVLSTRRNMAASIRTLKLAVTQGGLGTASSFFNTVSAATLLDNIDALWQSSVVAEEDVRARTGTAASSAIGAAQQMLEEARKLAESLAAIDDLDQYADEMLALRKQAALLDEGKAALAFQLHELEHDKLQHARCTEFTTNLALNLLCTSADSSSTNSSITLLALLENT